jgi:4-amino-4-deoxy-L-arabinose transferase-like glycosyltransferase
MSDALGKSEATAVASPRSTVALVCLIALLAVAIWSVHLGRDSYWEDELFSVYYPRAGLGYMWTKGISWEITPPLYYTLVWVWEGLFGVDEAAIRLLSVLLLAATVPIVFLLGSELFDRRHGLLGALLFALSPMAFHFAHEARSYALYSLSASIVLLAFARSLRRGATVGNLSLYVLAGAICLYTHATSILMIASCNLVALYGFLADRRGARWRDARNWILASAVLAVIGIPEAIATLSEVGTHSQGATGVYISRYQIADVFSELVAGEAAPLRFPGLELATLVFGAIAMALWLRPIPRPAWLVLVAVPSVFIAACILLSVTIKSPVLIARVFTWGTVPLSLMMAVAIFTPRMRVASIGAIGLAIFLGLGIGLAEPADPIEPWRTMLPQIEPELARADAVILLPYTSVGAFDRYAPQVRNLRVLADSGPKTLESTYMPQLLGAPIISTEDALDLIAHGKHVWVVGQYDYAPELRQLLEKAPQPLRRVERRCRNQHVCFLALQLS